MTEYRKQAERLNQSLGLPQPPIAVAFADETPSGIPDYSDVVPAGCKFWEEAATKTFATSAIHHHLCSIGVHTHNLSGAPVSQQDELQDTLEAMVGLDYVQEAEVASIPVMQRQHKQVIYGPLAESTTAPDAVLLFAHTEQGLILSEATARVDGAMPPAMGRPACAVLPQVLNDGRAAMSLGCCGARAYLDNWSDRIALWALPAAKLEDYCGQIEILSKANGILTTFHQRRRKDIESGERPSVQASLQKLG